MPRRLPDVDTGSKQAGLTLVELMITLMVLAVVATLAVPSFNALIRNNRIYTQVNDFHLALMRARAEAMSRVKRVTICTSSDAATCRTDTNAGNWEDGWIIFVEEHATQNAAVDTGEEILEVQQALSGETTLRGDTDVANYVSYVGTGFSAKAPSGLQSGLLALCDDRGISWGKTVRINAAGRPRVIHAGDPGSTTSCTSPAPSP